MTKEAINQLSKQQLAAQRLVQMLDTELPDHRITQLEAKVHELNKKLEALCVEKDRLHSNLDTSHQNIHGLIDILLHQRINMEDLTKTQRMILSNACEYVGRNYPENRTDPCEDCYKDCGVTPCLVENYTCCQGIVCGECKYE